MSRLEAAAVDGAVVELVAVARQVVEEVQRLADLALDLLVQAGFKLSRIICIAARKGIRQINAPALLADRST